MADLPETLTPYGNCDSGNGMKPRWTAAMARIADTRRARLGGVDPGEFPAVARSVRRTETALGLDHAGDR